MKPVHSITSNDVEGLPSRPLTSPVIEDRSSSSIQPRSSSPPDPQVNLRPVRRRFIASYKLSILEEADHSSEPGQIGALLRREGLYSSYLVLWRRQRRAGTLLALAPAKRGPKAQPPNPLAEENQKLPIALGHMIAVLLVIVLLLLARASLPLKALRIVLVAVLFGYGLYRFIRFRHQGWVGMRVGFRDLTLWSSIMASAHGAGLMLAPVLPGCPQAVQAHHDAQLHSAGVNLQAGHSGAFQLGSLAGLLDWIGWVVIHTAGHLIVSALIAILVYEKLGLALLRCVWFNMDILWVIALMLSGIILLIK